MSIQRLRTVLSSQYSASVRSDQHTVDRVNQLAALRQQATQTAGITPKPAQVVAALSNRPDLSFKAIDVLRKIGELTTPHWANLAQLSSSWATRRYFWAILPPANTPARFQLNPECADLDFHQKTLMSDEFGMGFAGLAMERLFETNAWADVSVAVDDPQRFQMVRKTSRLQPDFLMWRDQPDQPYYVVECKGSQSGPSVSYDQIRRGLEQVPALRFGAGRQVERLVIATLMQQSKTTIFVIDPEDDETNEEREKRLKAEKSERVSEKLNDNVWFIPDEERFQLRTADERSMQLLNWAGQYQAAATIEPRIRTDIPPRPQVANRPTSSKQFGGLTFDGYRVPLFPELLGTAIQVFAGVEHDTIDAARRAQDRLRVTLDERAETLHELQAREDGLTSIGLSGTCLAIEGIDPL